MFSHSRIALVITAAAALCGVAIGQAPVSSGFTYQGRLAQGGVQVDGPFDLTFRLFDLSAGGSQVGSTISLNDAPISDGLFSTVLDFGVSAFTGEARWIEIAVRPGASGGAYTTLSPRQSLTAAPYALYALNSPAGSDHWQAAGSAIMNSNTGFVGINRTAQVSGAEYFGIQAPATGTSYGGMYIRTDGSTAKPFYGYRAGAHGAWSYLDGLNGDWRVHNNGDALTIENDGQVGIGTTDPSAQLEIAAATGVALRATNAGTGHCAQFSVNDPADPASGVYSATYGGGYAGSFEAHSSNTTAALSCYKNSGTALRCISTLSTAGTAATDCVVAVVGGSDSEPTGGGFIVTGSVVGANISIDNNEIMARNDGDAATLFLNADGGTVDISGADVTRVKVLEITGADVAEKFPVSDAEKPAPGMVVMIDALNPGKLTLARGPYNQKVAGVVSGANDLPAGTILGNLPGSEDAPPIALSGRVWVHCDATMDEIRVGDLLTTSETAGHAMAARDPSRAHGAVIGKAMTALAAGEKGMVLVLINLQ